MKLLLDEQVPRNLAKLFPAEFTVATVQSMGWSSLSNGALLARASANGFDALITADKNMQYQQNEATLPMSVLVLMARGNRFDDLSPLIPKAVTILDGLAVPAFIRVAR